MGGKAKRHPDRALSATEVRNAKGPAKLYDGNGLFLRVELNGAKRWVQRLVVSRQVTRTRARIGLASDAG